MDVALSGAALKMLSTVGAAMFSGGAMYINVVESPSRMTHDAVSAITMWKPSYIRASSYQSKMVLLSGLSSLGAYACLRGDSPTEALHWFGAGCALLTIIPVTIVFISPLNSQLLETEKCISVKGDDWIVENLNYWNKLHSVRTLISLSAFSFMLYTLVKKH